MNLGRIDLPRNKESFEIFLYTLLCMKTNGIPWNLLRSEIVLDAEQVMFGL